MNPATQHVCPPLPRRIMAASKLAAPLSSCPALSKSRLMAPRRPLEAPTFFEVPCLLPNTNGDAAQLLHLGGEGAELGVVQPPERFTVHPAAARRGGGRPAPAREAAAEQGGPLVHPRAAGGPLARRAHCARGARRAPGGAAAPARPRAVSLSAQVKND